VAAATQDKVEWPAAALGEWERLGARADVLAPEELGPEEQRAPWARADMEEGPAVTEAPMAEPEDLLVDAVAGRRDAVQAEAPEPGRAGARVATAVLAGKVELALEAPVAAPVARGPGAVAAPAPAPQTPAQRAAPAVPAAPSASVRQGEAPAVPERCTPGGLGSRSPRSTSAPP
jgi:hypothetical protein